MNEPKPILPIQPEPLGISEDTLREIVEDAVHKAMMDVAVQKKNTVGEYMTTNELSEYIHLNIRWIYDNLNMIPHIRHSKRSKTLFRKKDIDKWLKNNTIAVSSANPILKKYGIR